MKKLNNWFEIDEQEYLMYILQGYEINVTEGYVIWLLDDKLHREDGPAIIHVDGTEAWFINDKRHREDGPAYIHENHNEYWINGNRVKSIDKYKSSVKI